MDVSYNKNNVKRKTKPQRRSLAQSNVIGGSSDYSESQSKTDEDYLEKTPDDKSVIKRVSNTACINW